MTAFRISLDNYSVSGEANELPVQPDFYVNSFGQLAFPLNESQAQDLIKVCKPTSFSTFNDNSQCEADVTRDLDLRVRDSFELDPSEFEIKNPEWQIKIDLLAQQAAEHLSQGFRSINSDGEKMCPVSVKLYRMLLYKINGHFGRHRDRIKEKNQFGTLVVQMPCKYTGGEFIAYKPDNTKEYCDLGQSSGKTSNGFHFTAHLIETEHEIKPVTSGYRLVLIYLLCSNEKVEFHRDY